MWSRRESRYWQSPEPCSCSKSIHSECEDYWEDASVCLKSAGDWEHSTRDCSRSPEREMPESFQTTTSGRYEQQKREGKTVPNAPQRSYSCDSVEETPAFKRRRSFPPPLASCATLSYKEGGRFVLKGLSSRPQGFFRAERGNGRLRLQLIEPLEADEVEQRLDGDPCNQGNLREEKLVADCDCHSFDPDEDDDDDGDSEVQRVLDFSNEESDDNASVASNDEIKCLTFGGSDQSGFAMAGQDTTVQIERCEVRGLDECGTWDLRREDGNDVRARNPSVQRPLVALFPSTSSSAQDGSQDLVVIQNPAEKENRTNLRCFVDSGDKLVDRVISPFDERQHVEAEQSSAPATQEWSLGLAKASVVDDENGNRAISHIAERVQALMVDDEDDGHHHHHAVFGGGQSANWNVNNDAGNGNGGGALKLWSSPQIFLHPSLTRMNHAVGLAIS